MAPLGQSFNLDQSFDMFLRRRGITLFEKAPLDPRLFLVRNFVVLYHQPTLLTTPVTTGTSG